MNAASKLNEFPCITGDGTSVSVSAGLQNFGTANFTVNWKVKYASNGAAQRIMDHRINGGANVIQIFIDANAALAYTANSVMVSITGSANSAQTITLTSGSWYDFTLVRTGSTATLTVTNLSTAATATVTSTSVSVDLSSTAYMLFLGSVNGGGGSPAVSLPSVCSIVDVSFTSGGSTTSIPLTDGLNAGRDLAKYVDGVESTISSAIVNGTLSSIWANNTSGTFQLSRYAAQAMYPRNTKFRRTKTDGDDRYFSTREALTSTNKTNAEAYVA